MKGLSIKTIGLSLSAVFALTYVLCVIWDLVFPGWAMYRVWQGLFPGFGWSIVGLLVGLVETVLYSVYAAAVFVPVYNGLHRREIEA
jgi:Na+-driven multidrug efflux pump